jgi:predicted permease
MTVQSAAIIAGTMRRLRRSLAFTATVVVTLATGIGSVVAMFSVYSRVVLNPVTVTDTAALVSIYAVNRKVEFVPPTVSWPRFEMIRRHATAFGQLGAYTNAAVAVNGGDGVPEQLRGLRVSGDFFGALAARAARGRLFTSDDDLPNGPAVCLLSYELWQSRFGGRDVVGTTIKLDGASTEVIGVLSPRLSPPWADRQIFQPRVVDDAGLNPKAVSDGATFLEVVGRLRPGVTATQAATELHGIARAYAIQFAGRSDAASDLELGSLVETVVGNRRATFSLLLGAVAVVLLVSCANASALTLSHLASRHRETSIRQALGASRMSLLAQFLGESLALAAVAGVIGLLFAKAALVIIQASVGGALPPGVQLHADGSALAVAAGIVLLSAVLVGLVPALHVTRPSAASAVTAFGRGMSDGAATRRFRSGLVVAEVALSVFLLVGAALLLTSLRELQRSSPGFDPPGVAAAFTPLPRERYRTSEQQASFYLDIAERLRADPQVSGAAIVFGLPFHDDNYASAYVVSGRPIPPASDRSRAGLRIISEDYFKVMRIGVLEGRAFTAADRTGAHGVCIVNESLARRQFAGRSAIGNVILRGHEANQAFEIVGVVSDVKTNGLRSATPDEIFYPFRQLPRPDAAIVARTNGNAELLAALFQSAVAAIDPDVPVARFATMDSRLAATLGPERTMAGLTSAFAALAVLLAAVGLYAVLAHGVSSRTVEIGIRMAVGADRAAIVRLVLSQAMRLVAFGIGCGVIAAALLSRLLAAQLYELSPTTPWVYALVSVVFAAIGVAASLAPALRAAHVDPVVSLGGS